MTSSEDEDARLARQAAKLARHVQELRDEYVDLSEEELIAMTFPTPVHVTAPMEMQRRLIVAIGELRASLDAFTRSSTRVGWTLVAFTVVLVVLTTVLLV